MKKVIILIAIIFLTTSGLFADEMGIKIIYNGAWKLRYWTLEDEDCVTEMLGKGDKDISINQNIFGESIAVFVFKVKFDRELIMINVYQKINNQIISSFTNSTGADVSLAVTYYEFR